MAEPRSIKERIRALSKEETTVVRIKLTGGVEIAGKVDTDVLEGVFQVYSEQDGASWAVPVEHVVAIGYLV